MRRLFDFRLASPGDHHRGAAPSEQQRRSAPDAGSPARDQSNLAVQILRAHRVVPCLYNEPKMATWSCGDNRLS
jgi:hypothetical protein